MFVVDTNILVYAVDERAADHKLCRRAVESWRDRSFPWFTTWPVLYEFLRVVSHPRVLKRPRPMGEGVEMVRAILRAPGLSILLPTDRHAEILADTASSVPDLHGSIAHDLGTVVLMREHGIRRIVTRDAGFRRFPFVEVVDPAAADGTDVVRERAPRGRYAAKSRATRS